MKDIVAAVVNEHFDVRLRLEKLHQWDEECKQEDQALLKRLQVLNPAKPMDMEVGDQIGTFRQRLQARRIREPLEIDAKLTLTSYKALRLHLREQFAVLSKEDRLLWLNNLLFVMSSDLWQLHKKVQLVLSDHSLGQQRNFLLAGRSGIGKTTYLDWISALNLPFVESERNWVPIIKINAPMSQVAPRALLRRMILECGRTYFKGDSEEDLLSKFNIYLQQCGVELIIVDEVEHLIRHEMRRRLLDISNKTLGIPIICASCDPISWTIGDDEIAGRWNDCFTLSPYTGERLADFLTFIEVLLPFTQPSNLSVYQITKPKVMDGPAKLIERWTDGTLRYIMILLREASRRAIKADLPCLSTALLEETWKEIQTQPVSTSLP
jgi:hypothetical protein